MAQEPQSMGFTRRFFHSFSVLTDGVGETSVTNSSLLVAQSAVIAIVLAITLGLLSIFAAGLLLTQAFRSLVRSAGNCLRSSSGSWGRTGSAWMNKHIGTLTGGRNDD